MVGLALAAGAGVMLSHLGVHPAWTLPSLTLLFRRIPSSRRPQDSPAPFALAFLAGALTAHAWAEGRAADCRYFLEEGAFLEVEGRLVGRVLEERGEIRPVEPDGDGCREPLRFVLAEGALSRGVEPGARVVLRGHWRRSAAVPGQDPLRAGYLRAEGVAPAVKDGAPRWDPGAFGGKVQLRLGELFPNEGGLVEALVLARKEGLSPDLRESFARAGTAHLLAISGFHVGVVAGLLFLAGSWMGLSHPRRLLLGSGGVWGYVLFIGLPDAALRAALILTLLSLGRFGHRHVAPLGALASSFLVFLSLDPGAVLRPGFQLSFAGATGLVLWARPITRAISGVGRSRNDFPYLSTAVAAGVSATLATVPLVAWHFGRVSLVGIPVTLLAAPLVTLAIPGIFLCLVASFVSRPLGFFFAHGVEADLWLFRSLVDWAGTLPLASVWVSRPGVVAGLAGMALARLLWSVLPRERRWGRRTLLGTAAIAGLILWPVADRVAGWGTLEMVVLDVGQGDAILLRSPRGRWILVDAGPRTDRYDAGARAVLPYLRRRGAGGLALMVLTHPDMDHVGGAGAILREYPVGRVMDPGMAVGTGVFLDALEGAQAREVPWTVGVAGDSLDLDGVAIRVLWPPEEKGEIGEAEGANGASLVLEVRLGSFSALLTGDAPAEVEETLLPRLLSPSIQVLKLGHHGSRTSTSPELLERITPEVALISAGLRNRFGHPHAAVLRRLEARGVKVYRTDQDGTLTLQARKDGSYRVRKEHGGAGFESIPVDPRKR